MYDTLNGWTKEKMKKQIRENMQDHPSMESGRCCYRAPDGNKCAVGCFIPDEIYDWRFENTNVFGICERFMDVFPLNIKGMTELQKLHDSFKYGEFVSYPDPRPSLYKWIDDNVVDVT